MFYQQVNHNWMHCLNWKSVNYVLINRTTCGRKVLTMKEFHKDNNIFCAKTTNFNLVKINFVSVNGYGGAPYSKRIKTWWTYPLLVWLFSITTTTTSSSFVEHSEANQRIMTQHDSFQWTATSSDLILTLKSNATITQWGRNKLWFLEAGENDRKIASLHTI